MYMSIFIGHCSATVTVHKHNANLERCVFTDLHLPTPPHPPTPSPPPLSRESTHSHI